MTRTRNGTENRYQNFRYQIACQTLQKPWYRFSSPISSKYVIGISLDVLLLFPVGKRAEMSVVLLQLSLCVVNVILMTSSQSTYDVSQDANGCGTTEQLLSQLITVVSQLQRDIAELKTVKQPVKGRL